jgi:hypothetical protein
VREGKQDPFDAITAVIPWDRFRVSVAVASALARSKEFDPYQLLGEYYAGLRRWTPAFLATFIFQGVPAVASLLRAIDMLRDMNDAARPGPPKYAPTGFIREQWARHVLPGGDINRATMSSACYPSCRFGSPLVLSRVHWLRPELVAEVKYLTWTEDNLLRQVVYEGLREDKPAAEVPRSVPHPKHTASTRSTVSSKRPRSG